MPKLSQHYQTKQSITDYENDLHEVQNNLLFYELQCLKFWQMQAEA